MLNIHLFGHTVQTSHVPRQKIKALSQIIHKHQASNQVEGQRHGTLLQNIAATSDTPQASTATTDEPQSINQKHQTKGDMPPTPAEEDMHYP
jgi:hypothetical protein